ncbi:hypothetical protein FORC066_3732 [Yersinia enterocolitica]|nr:hypothetical protein FORC065_0803 [Yersinia enterocolitica]UXD30939.1 hypothetical protein FORC066_3732 [Yersinia enterocolitica]
MALPQVKLVNPIIELNLVNRVNANSQHHGNLKQEGYSRLA